ncbi:MAG TPA: zinc metallopeptidase [Anaerolineae bacterium]|nr:zinc metallopeptidase [Anaerolineae bacterium]
MFMFNPLYLLLILPALLAWFAQGRVRQVYKKYNAVSNSRGLSGLAAARYLLAHHGLNDVAVERASGQLTDHYDPQTRTLRLSDGVANASTVTALGIVAHEVGHAVQHAEGYRFMQARAQMARWLTQAGRWSTLVFIGGIWFGNLILLALGGVMLAAMVVFAVVTLPVERNASNRAVAMLDQTGLAVSGEGEGARQVLRAAAFTYLAALGQRLATFLFFVAVFGAARVA